MLTIKQNWGKIANYPPNAQQRSAALASSIPVLGLDRVCPREVGLWPRIFLVSLALVSSLVSSSPPLVIAIDK